MATFDFVQDDANAFGVVTSGNLAFGLNVTAGNTILALVQVGALDRVVTVTDDRDNTYVPDREQAVGSTELHLVRASNVAGGATTVTVAIDGAAALLRLVIVEYEGNLELDQVASTSGTAVSSSVTTGSATTVANELVVGPVSTDTITTFTPGAGYTGRAIAGSRVTIEDKIVSATGTQTADWDFAAASKVFAAIVATYKEAGTGGGGLSLPIHFSPMNVLLRM